MGGYNETGHYKLGWDPYAQWFHRAATSLSGCGPPMAPVPDPNAVPTPPAPPPAAPLGLTTPASPGAPVPPALSNELLGALGRPVGRRLAVVVAQEGPAAAHQAHWQPVGAAAGAAVAAAAATHRALLQQRVPAPPRAVGNRTVRTPLSGPSWPDIVSLSPGLLAGMANRGRCYMGDLTVHYYALSNRSATLSDLMSEARMRDAMAKLAALSAEARGVGSQLRISETNSMTGGGRPGVSETFGAALWTLDMLFESAAAGVSGVNLHCEWGRWGWGLRHPPKGVMEDGGG